MNPRRRVHPVLGSMVGLALLAAAFFAVRSQAAALSNAWTAFRAADPALWILAALLPLGNWLISSEVLVALTARFKPVPRSDMVTLTGSAWLLNYLPLRPGLVGRVAFHRAVHGIPVRDSARVLIESIVLGSVAAAALGAAALCKPFTGPLPIIGLAVLAPCIALAALFGRGTPGSPMVRTAMYVIGLKTIDSLIWALRYMLVFQLTGRPIDLPSAVAFSVVSQAATLIPLAGNGLGLREWAVGLLATALPTFTGESPLAAGLSADMVNRALEVLIAIPVGGISSLWIARRFRKGASASPGHAETRL